MAEQVEPIEFLRTLRAVRRFVDKPIPDAVVDDLLNVARWTGSASNRQQWSFVIVRDRETLQKLSELHGYAKHLAGAAMAIALVMDGSHMVEQETFDEGRLAERLMLVAKAHGVGACIGWFREEGADQAKALLGIPAERLLRTAISFGYEDVGADGARSHPEQPRKPMADLVHQERW